MKKNLTWICMAVAVVVIAGALFLFNYLGVNDDSTVATDASKNKTEQTENGSTPENTDETANQGKTGESQGAEEEVVYGARGFVVTDNSGKEINMTDMKGKPVVVNFWASSTPSSKEELDVFEKMYKECGDEIAFMMVNMTDGKADTLDSAKKFIKDNKFTFPVYFDTTMEAATTYNVSGLPASFFIDAEGNFITYAQGAIDYETLGRGIEMIK